MKTKRSHPLTLMCGIALMVMVDGAAMAQTPTASTALDAVLPTLCPGAHLVENAARQADFDGNGITDVAVLVECPGGPDRRLVVFRGYADGTLRAWAQSAAWPVDPHRWDGLQVQKNVLIYQQGCEASCSEPTGIDYKFRYRQGAFVLMGQEQRHMWRDEERGKEIQVDTGVSVNYLSGRVIYFGKRGATRFERSLDFGSLPLVPLADFDADKADDQHRQIHALSGYLDAKLILHFTN